MDPPISMIGAAYGIKACRKLSSQTTNGSIASNGKKPTKQRRTI
jgi:hypothetical protein